MSKQSPFDIVKSINKKNRLHDLSGYNPFLTNRAFAYHMDTVLYAEEMNQYSELSPDLQYDFYYYAVRKGDRFGFPAKPQEEHHIELVMEYFSISKQKAVDALRLLTLDDINDIISITDKGGQ